MWLIHTQIELVIRTHVSTLNSDLVLSSPVCPQSGKRAEKVPHSRESQASTREGRGGQRGNVIHPEDSVRNGRGNSQNLTAKVGVFTTRKWS